MVELGKSINSFTESISTNKIVHTIASNPVWTTLLVIVICVIFVHNCYSFKRSNFAMWVYMYVTVLSVLFVHNKILSLDLENASNHSIIDDMLQPSPSFSEVPMAPSM